MSAFDNLEIEMMRKEIIRDAAVAQAIRIGDGLREQMAGSIGVDSVSESGFYDADDNYVSWWVAGDEIASAPNKD